MEITPHIHCVDGTNANSYIVARERLTVIDTGLKGNGQRIRAYIRDTLHRNPAEIGTIIITHFHLDHTGGIAVLREAAPGAKLACHEADAEYLSGKRPVPRYPGFRGLILSIAGIFMQPEPVSPDILLHGGDRIDGLICIHTPGHTLGSIGLLDTESKVFFCGDTIRHDGTALTTGPVFATMDPVQERASITKIGDLDFDILLVGHGLPLRKDAAVKVRELAAALPAV